MRKIHRAAALAVNVAVAALGAIGFAQAASHKPAWSARDISGIWMQDNPGKWPAFPYTSEFQAIYDRGRKAEAGGIPPDDPASRCITSGMPGVFSIGAYAWEILNAPDHITMIKENLGSTRRIYLKRGHDLDWGPTYMGDSIGRWEGDTLVVDTVSLRDDTRLDARNAPHSDQLHIVERITRVSKDQLRNEITLEDPKAFTAKVTGVAILTRHPDWEIHEFVCDNNRNTLKDGKPTIIP